MDLDRFLNLTAAVFGGMGSIYVLKALALLSPNIIERLSRTYVGFNIAQIDSIAAQKADSIVGMVLVALALVIAIVNFAFVPSSQPIRVGNWGVSIALVGALAGVVYVSLFFVGDAIRRSEKRAVCRLIATEEVGELLESKRLPEGAVGSLRAWARILLEMQVDDSEPPQQLLRRVAKELGLNIPEGFDFSDVEKPAR